MLILSLLMVLGLLLFLVPTAQAQNVISITTSNGATVCPYSLGGSWSGDACTLPYNFGLPSGSTVDVGSGVTLAATGANGATGTAGAFAGLGGVGGAGGDGGDGIISYGTIDNYGTIITVGGAGGAGGGGENDVGGSGIQGGAGGAAGAGIYNGGTIYNYGTITATGGVGGAGGCGGNGAAGVSLSFGGSGASGGSGGYGIFSNVGIYNYGTITATGGVGGAGGCGGNGGNPGVGGNGGSFGDAVHNFGTVENQGTITAVAGAGGAGGPGGCCSIVHPGAGGNGASGIYSAAGGTIYNYGTIASTGGSGGYTPPTPGVPDGGQIGYGGVQGGGGGYGVYDDTGGQIYNHGTITADGGVGGNGGQGGQGGPAPVDSAFGATGGTGGQGGTGGYGVYNPGAIYNYGTATANGGQGGQGGQGGIGGTGIPNGGVGGVGGLGGLGGTFGDGIHNPGTIYNNGTITATGGVGGTGGTGGTTGNDGSGGANNDGGQGGNGNNGASGIYSTGTITSIGTVTGNGGTGGQGGQGGTGFYENGVEFGVGYGGIGGNGGTGVYNDGGSAINNANAVTGTPGILGGGGFGAAQPGCYSGYYCDQAASGSDGTAVNNGGTINNYCGATISGAGGTVNSVTCSFAVFGQEGIPATGVTWGVSATWGIFGTMDHTGTGYAITVYYVGSATFSYDSPITNSGVVYECTTGCSGTASGGGLYGLGDIFTAGYMNLNTSASVNCSPSPVVWGYSTTCTATVVGSSPTGTVTFSTNSSTGTFSPANGECTLSGDSCSVSYSDSAPFPNITASYPGDSHNVPASGSFALNVKSPSTINGGCFPSQGQVGSSVTCTVNVSTLSAWTWPKGVVTLTTNSSTGTFSPANGECTLQVATNAFTSAGTCSVTYSDARTSFSSISVSYPGNSYLTPSSGTFSFQAVKGGSKTSVSCSPSSFPETSSTTCTATVVGSSPTGTVTFSTNSSTGTFSPANGVCGFTSSGSSGSCTITYSDANPGHPVITADYSGDSANLASEGTFSLTVEGTTTTSVSCTPSTFTAGSSTTCTAVVATSSSSGTVTFTSTSPTGTFSPANGVCSFTSSGSCSVTYVDYTNGSPTITASYPGDSNNAPSSQTFSLTVTQGSTQTSVSCSPNQVAAGSTATCTATVSGAGRPTGTVTFTSTSSTGSFSPADATCALSGDSCSVAYVGPASATPTITASYPGDSNNAPSSQTFSLTVTGSTPVVSITTSNGATVCGSGMLLDGTWDAATHTCILYGIGILSSPSSLETLDIGAGVTVSGNFLGVNVADMVINNYGTIVGTGSSAYCSVACWGVSVSGLGTINNYGTIVGSVSTACGSSCLSGAQAVGIQNDGGLINNAGTITGTITTGYGDAVHNYNGGVINNAGTIYGTITGYSTYAIYNTATINNAGTMAGVASGTYSFGLYNGGTINDYCGASVSVDYGNAPNSFSCYTVNFAQSGIPSNVYWGVSVSWSPSPGVTFLSPGYIGMGGVNPMQATGTITYSYDSPLTAPSSSSSATYTCIAGCTGTASVPTSVALSAVYSSVEGPTPASPTSAISLTTANGVTVCPGSFQGTWDGATDSCIVFGVGANSGQETVGIGAGVTIRGGDSGVIFYDVTVNNYGTVIGSLSGSCSNLCAGIYNFGDSVINNAGTVVGTLLGCGSGECYGIYNTATINNAGTMAGTVGPGVTAYYSSLYGIYNTATINNAGTMAGVAYGPYSSGLYNGGTINDYCGASVSVDYGNAPNSFSCYTVNFAQSGIPPAASDHSPVSWGVSVSWSPSPGVTFLSPAYAYSATYTGALAYSLQFAGSLNYSFDSPLTAGPASSSTMYECSSNCVGTISATQTSPPPAQYTAFVPASTTTAVNCSPSSGLTDSSISCTATVTDTSSSPTTPTEDVTFSSDPAIGTLNLPASCTLSGSGTAGVSSCAVTFTPASGSQASYMVNASYGGDQSHYASSGTGALIIEQPDTTAQGSSTTAISGGGVSSDQSSTTGASVTVSGSSASEGTSVTITTEDLSSPSANVAASILSGSQYYDVSVFGISDGTAQVCLTTSTGTSMQYWDGSQWVNATAVTVSGSTICGDIPVSALTGTNVVIGQLTYSVTFTQNGIPSGVTWSVTVGSSTYTGQGASIPVTGLQGTQTYVYESIVAGSTGTRYGCSGATCSGSVDAQSVTIATGYQTQYLVSFAQAGTPSAVSVQWDFGNGTAGSGTAPFAIWADASSSNNLSYQYPPSLAGTAGVRYVLTSVLPGSLSSISGPATTEGSYQTQYLITFDQTGSGSPVTVSYGFGGGNSTTGSAPAGSSIWVDATTSTITFTYPGTVPGPAGTRYALSSVDTQSPLSISSPATVTGDYGTQYLLTVNGGNNVQASVPSGDGWYDAGTPLRVSSDWTWGLTPGQSRTAASNYVINGVLFSPPRQGSGTLTTGTITMGAPQTVIFSSVTQYYLAVSGGNGVVYGTPSPTSDNWYDAGSSTTVSSNGIWGRSNGIGQRVESWNIDGGTATLVASSGTITSTSIDMNTFHTVAFNDLTQYQVTLDSGATSALLSITHPSIPGDNYWYDSGTPVAATLNGVFGRSGGVGTRVTSYTLDGVRTAVSTTGQFVPLNLVQIEEAHSITAATTAQNYLAVVGGNSVAYGTGPSIHGDTGWYDEGTSTTISSSGVYGRSGTTGERVASWSLDGGASIQVHTTGTATTAAVLMDGPHTISFSSVEQFFLTDNNQLGAEGSVTSPAVAGDTGWYDQGTVVTVSLNNVYGAASGQRNNLVSYTVDGSSTTVTRGGLGSQSYQLTMTEPHTISSTYEIQFQLVVTGGSNVQISASSPTGDSWFDSGASLTVSTDWTWGANAGQRTAATNYQIDGVNGNPVRYGSGTLTTSSITMDGAHEVVFVPVTQYYLTVNGGNGVKYGTPSPTLDNWYDAGTSTTVSSSGAYGRSGGAGERVASWSIDGGATHSAFTTGTVTTSAIAMNGPHTLSFNSVEQFYLSDSNPLGAVSSVTPPAVAGDAGWYDYGTAVTVSLNNVYGASTSQRNNLVSYAIDGTITSVTRAGSGTQSYLVTMTGPHDVSSTYRAQYLLTVTGGSGVQVSATSPTNDGWYDSGTQLTVSSDWTWNTNAGQRTAISNYQFDGASQNPTREGSGILTTSTITMSSAHAVAFQSVTQYYVTVTSAYGTISLTGSQTGDNWFDSGSSATFSVSTPVSCGSGCREVFTAWAGTGAGSYSQADNPATMAVVGAVTESAGWQLQYLLTVGTAPSTLTAPLVSPGSSSGYYNSGTKVSLTASQAPGYAFILWQVDGTNGSLLANSTQVTMSQPHSAVAYYDQPTGALHSMVSTVDGMKLQHGIQTSLDSKLSAALGSTVSGNSNAAVHQLNAFINEVNAQTGKAITPGEGQLLLAEAQEIIGALQP